MKFKVEGQKIIKAVKKLDGIEIVLENTNDAKEAVNRSQEGDTVSGYSLESYLHALTCTTEDKKEGVQAFLEKRKGTFKGK